MLNRDSRPTNPVAAVAATDDVPPSRKKSWIIGPACSRMPMPAVTLQNSTTHSSQNCGVLIAFVADTCAVVTSGFDLSCDGSKPAGCHPGAGTFTVKTPSIITMKYTMPSVTNSNATALPVATDFALDGS